ncbi:MAG: hypothetical protein RXR82_01455 [Nitrososphaeria archaeon]
MIGTAATKAAIENPIIVRLLPTRSLSAPDTRYPTSETKIATMTT